MALNREQVETRIHIREFILRFASALQIASSNVDELEELAGPSLGTLGEWEDQEDFELVGWVSEGCLKAMVLGLLDVIAGAVQASGTREQLQTLKEAIKSIRLGGPNLTRIWSTLRSLRDTLGQVGNLFAFELSDPLPPPTTMVFRSTRSGQQGAVDIHISSSAQLVYVVFDLLEIALCSPAIRDAIEAGVTDEKDLGKEVKDALLRENAQWKAIKDVKKAKDDVKMNRERHKQMLQDVEYAHRIATRRCIPRFTSLGQDAEGRVYYILSPGAAERDSAQQLLVGKDVKVKYGRKRGPVTEEDRKELKRWSWFVLIWGRKPRGALVARDEDEDDEEDEEEECWWAFWNPTEIQKLAEWHIRKHGLDGTEPLTLAPKLAVSKASSSRKRSSLVNSRALSPLSDLSSDEDEEDSMEEDGLAERAPTHSELLTLVQGLKDFGELLQWRVQRLAGDETVEKAGQEPAKTSTIPASRFYS